MPIPQVVGSFGEDHLNRNGRELREFATFNNLKITNTFFRKKDIHKYTWTARGLRSIIDYVMVNKKLASQVRDTRVYRGSDINSDHYLLKSDIEILARWKKKYTNDYQHNQRKVEVFKVHLLRQESVKYLYQHRIVQKIEGTITSDDIEEEWVNIKTIISGIRSFR